MKKYKFLIALFFIIFFSLQSLKADEAQISALNHPRVFGWYSFISKFSDAKKA